jgi:hypothetical protein
MNPSDIHWLLDSDPALRWQVERDLLEAPEAQWQATRDLTSTTGFGAKLLSLQDTDGQWAGGAHFPGRVEPRALVRDGGDDAQPFIATSWSLNALREWGVDARALGDTAQRLEASCRWEYDDLPFWQGEVDCCINAFTLANGVWLGVDVSENAQWFIEHQLADGGWNCEWVEGSTRSSFHSTLNSLNGLLDFEKTVGRNEGITAARKRGEEYLLTRSLMFKQTTNELVGEWVTQFYYPARWRYSTLRALDYFREAGLFDSSTPDCRLEQAAESIRAARNAKGRWVNQRADQRSVWFEVDAPLGQESKWLTLSAIRSLRWWDSR